MYEIIKTHEDHIVLYHETAPISILSTALEDTLPIRGFTLNNPLIPDDVFQSPPRDYDNIACWIFHIEDGTISPSSNNSSSEGYFSGPDWSTDSSWISYDSLVQSVFLPPISSPFRPISPLPLTPEVPQETRGLSQPPRCRETSISRGTPKEGKEEIDQNMSGKSP